MEVIQFNNIPSPPPNFIFLICSHIFIFILLYNKIWWYIYIYIYIHTTKNIVYAWYHISIIYATYFMTNYHLTLSYQLDSNSFYPNFHMNLCHYSHWTVNASNKLTSSLVKMVYRCISFPNLPLMITYNMV
jgi:hypothetical protein